MLFVAALVSTVLPSTLNRAQDRPAAASSVTTPSAGAAGQASTPEEERAYRTSMEEADQKIAAEVEAHSELMKNLEYLSTEIGPRLTGSPQMQKASDWTLERFKAYGIDAHLETDNVAHAWYRGEDTAEIESPIKHVIGVRSMGWSKATDGEITGPVYFLGDDPQADVDRLKDKLKGAIVCLGPPATLATGEADNAYDAVIPPPQGVPSNAGPGGFRARMRVMPQLANAGVAAILRDSGKPNSLFNMGGAGPAYQPSVLPMAFATHEDYSLLHRLSEAGPLSLKINLKGTFSSGPEPASITVAEIKGTRMPDQRVIIGGHLDSWDLGQGSLDNGTGAMATLEAARALKALGWQPKRTITFILFTGEEEGGIGVRKFLKDHESEIPKIDAVLIHDTGTGRVFSIALENLWETAPLFMRIYEPLEEVFEMRPPEARYYGGSDHVAFLNAGVPAYFGVQLPAGYREAHHSQADTFDKVLPDQINEGAALLAAWAWNTSELPESLPHHGPQQVRGPH
ncbi:MAG TPA: M20/M25/M40 family metallo-hydrolase [Fimbriimonadaceae bacterium]|nr:M20/M25/M40 family metallo-hydrolase [Fimbriimonadaceae bacterium]